jgi:hypothetical protein
VKSEKVGPLSYRQMTAAEHFAQSTAKIFLYGSYVAAGAPHMHAAADEF